jgi:hypothetical protein
MRFERVSPMIRRESELEIDCSLSCDNIGHAR